MSQSGVYTSETHQVTPMALRSEQVCSYDLDDVDQRWLNAFNGERALSGETPRHVIELLYLPLLNAAPLLPSQVLPPSASWRWSA